MAESIVSLIDVEKRFGSNLVVRKMNMEIYEGEFLTLWGPPAAVRPPHCG